MAAQRTLVLVKPDGVQRGLVGEILLRLEQRGLKLVGLKLMRISKDVAARHYAEHQGKPFYDGLLGFITSGPVVAMIWEGREAVSVVRSLMGATDPLKAAPGGRAARLRSNGRPLDPRIVTRARWRSPRRGNNGNVSAQTQPAPQCLRCRELRQPAVKTGAYAHVN